MMATAAASASPHASAAAPLPLTSHADPPALLPLLQLHYPPLIDKVTVSDLLPLIRNRNYHRHRDELTRTQLHQIILANALISRLVSILYYTHSLLVRLVVNHAAENDTSADFSALNQTAQQLQNVIVAQHVSSFLPLQELQVNARTQDSSSPSSPSRSFLDELSPTASTTLLNFLTTVRSDPNFLVARLLHCKDHDLDILLSRKAPHHPHSSKTKSSSLTDQITSFHRHDPLFILSSALYSSSHPSESALKLDIWSSCLASLIDKRRGERLVLAILDVWASGESSCSSAFEVIVLDFLQNAANVQLSKRQFRDEVSSLAVGVLDDPEMTELYDATLVEILELVAGISGLPSCVIQLVNMVFWKCEEKDISKSMMFTKWFIRQFLSRNILYPEYRGILNDSYVSEDQRFLLQSLYNRLETHNNAHGTETSHMTEEEIEIHKHLDTLTRKFFPDTQPTLDPSPESPIQPVIVLCPADILTLFNALYPTPRPASHSHALPHPSQPRHNRKPSGESAVSDVLLRSSTDFIRPILKKSTTTTIFDLNQHNEGSTSSEGENAPSPEPVGTPLEGTLEEMDFYGLSVKAAMEEMKRRLGWSVWSGEMGPVEESWVTLFVKRDGSGGLERVPEFEVQSEGEDGEEEEEIIVSREDDELIRETIVKLAESRFGVVQRKSFVWTDESTPYRWNNDSLRHDLMNLAPSTTTSQPNISFPLVQQQPNLLSTLSTAAATRFAQGDYIQSQSYARVHDLLSSLTSSNLTQQDFSSTLGVISRRIQKEGNHHLNVLRTREIWFSNLLESRHHLATALSKIQSNISTLRCKMWYTHHVRLSKSFQRAKDVCEALQKMKLSKSLISSSSNPSEFKGNSNPLDLARSNSLHRSDSTTRRFLPSRQSFDGFSFSSRPASMYSLSSSLNMASDDWLDLLSAPIDQGGPHKLSDYQVDVTNRWLEEHASENFCKGEELIHRFIAEIDDLARRLVPDSADEMTVVASTFWEQEEFVEEAKAFGMTESVSGGSGERRSEEMMRNQSAVDLFGLLSRARGKTFTGGTGVDVSDTRSIRSTHSRTASMSVNFSRPAAPLPDVFVRPSSSHSMSYPPPAASPATSFFSKASVGMSRSTSCVDEKGANEFLEVTRQRLVSLLLSELGEIWSGGSETDEWFSDGLADSCLERNRHDRKASLMCAPPPVRKAKKSSFVPGSRRPPMTRNLSATATPRVHTPPLSREGSANGQEGTEDTTSSQAERSKTFDFKAAYKRLLLKFSVLPSPQAKLNALFELEQLLNASFAIAPQNDDNRPDLPFEDRLPPTPLPSPLVARKVSSSSTAVGTDDMVDQIQELLRDPAMRPKSLFRDLAFISAFVPPITLTHHGEGKVFWDIGLAASAMKTDVVNSMVECYEEIMAGNERASSKGHPRTRTMSVGKMHDAARMLLIAACEGNAVAQRELALLHLSHPSLLPFTTLPLSRPSDTFQKASMKGVVDNKDKYDPDRIALATHWFRLAAKNGDKYAQNVEGNWLGSRH